MTAMGRLSNDHLVRAQYWLTWLTACIALAAGLRVDLDRPGYHLAAALGCAVLGGLLMVARSARGLLSDWMSDFTSQEILLAVVLHALLFFGPSVAMRSWSPLAGLTILLIPGVPAAVDEGGFARLRILTAFIIAVAAGQAEPGFGWTLWPPWLALIVAGMGVEYAAVSLQRHSQSEAPPVSRVVMPAVGRLALATVVSLPLLIPLIAIMPESSGPRSRTLLPGSAPPPRSFGISADSGIGSFFYLLALAILTVLMIAAIRRIRSLLARDPQGEFLLDAALVESEHVPSRARRGAKGITGTPRNRMVQWYNSFSESLKPMGLERPAAASPAEYADELRSAGLVPDSLLGDMTARFVEARYGPAEPTESDADGFQRVIQAAMESARRQGENQE